MPTSPSTATESPMLSHHVASLSASSCSLAGSAHVHFRACMQDAGWPEPCGVRAPPSASALASASASLRKHVICGCVRACACRPRPGAGAHVLQPAAAAPAVGGATSEQSSAEQSASQLQPCSHACMRMCMGQAAERGACMRRCSGSNATQPGCTPRRGKRLASKRWLACPPRPAVPLCRRSMRSL